MNFNQHNTTTITQVESTRSYTSKFLATIAAAPDVSALTSLEVFSGDHVTTISEAEPTPDVSALTSLVVGDHVTTISEAEPTKFNATLATSLIISASALLSFLLIAGCVLYTLNGLRTPKDAIEQPLYDYCKNRALKDLRDLDPNKYRKEWKVDLKLFYDSIMGLPKTDFSSEFWAFRPTFDFAPDRNPMQDGDYIRPESVHVKPVLDMLALAAASKGPPSSFVKKYPNVWPWCKPVITLRVRTEPCPDSSEPHMVLNRTGWANPRTSKTVASMGAVAWPMTSWCGSIYKLEVLSEGEKLMNYQHFHQPTWPDHGYNNMDSDLNSDEFYICNYLQYLFGDTPPEKLYIYVDKIGWYPTEYRNRFANAHLTPE